MIILGVETSCDETAASVVEGKGESVKVLSNVVSSQIEIHKKYYGVVPEIAAREHILNILPVINEALDKAKVNPPRLARREPPLPRRGIFSTTPKLLLQKEGRVLDAIAVTTGPGLITSLIVGVETAKTLAYVWNLPIVGVNHIEGHVYANFIQSQGTVFGKPPPDPSLERRGAFPALILTVSGGHTMLILMKGHGKFQTIGDTRDDAAGEAFDKAAKLLGLGYPGGPAVSKMAAEFTSPQTHPVRAARPPLLRGESLLKGEGVSVPSPFQGEGQDEVKNRIGQVILPRPMLNEPNFDFSFSGLKTALLYKIQKDKDWQNKIPEYCYEFERAIVETLVGKAVKAAKKYQVKTMMLAGGVSANLTLREEFQNAAAKLGVACHIPPLEYTTDNAAMIAAAGYFRARRKSFTPWKKLKADANLEL